ncbi:MAG: glycosyltransferase family 39 protein [Anaerolineae bacterium]|nr:glycosyltransferase family 39 protein [Anaerolineae bacterium]
MTTTVPAQTTISTANRLRTRLRALAADLVVPLTVFAASRLGLFLVAYLGLALIPVPNSNLARPFGDNLFLDGWTRWDGAWYKNIGLHGYSNIPTPKGHIDTAFFPFYPLLIYLTHLVVPNGYLAGLLVSNLAFLLALCVLHKLARLYLDDAAARRSLVLLAVSPFAFYFSAVYSESVFLLAVVAAFYLGERRQWVWAGLAVAAASATRAVGILTIPALLVLYLDKLEFQWRRIQPDILGLGLGAGGLGAFMLYLAVQFGNPLQFIASQNAESWGFDGVADALHDVQTALSWSALLNGSYEVLPLIHLLFFLGALVLGVAAWRVIGPAYGLWTLLVTLASFTVFVGMGRYVAATFPVFMVAAVLLRDTRWYQAALYISTLLLGLFTLMFTHWMWLT